MIVLISTTQTMLSFLRTIKFNVVMSLNLIDEPKIKHLKKLYISFTLIYIAINLEAQNFVQPLT